MVLGKRGFLLASSQPAVSEGQGEGVSWVLGGALEMLEQAGWSLGPCSATA